MKQDSTLALQKENDAKDNACIDVTDADTAPSEAALGALLADADADEPAADAEGRVRRLAERLAQLDAANVAGMLAAASEGGGRGERLAVRLDAALGAAAALATRRTRAARALRAAGAADPDADGDPHRTHADAAARRLLRHLRDLLDWLDAPPLRDLDALGELSLASEEGRARALAVAAALRAALRRAEREPAARRLAAVRERLRRLARARDQLAAALARHLNNALVHLGNEAQAGSGRPAAPRRHHAELLPYAPFMRWLKDMDSRAFDGLGKLYTGTWARVYEREVRAASDAARADLAQAPPDRVDAIFDGVLGLVETICDAEQEFCTQFFHLDVDVKSDGSDGERSERSEAGERSEASERRAGADSRRYMAELFPTLEADLLALVAYMERHDPYGAMRALACAGRRALGGGAAEGGDATWARWAVAAAAVGAKRAADRAVAARRPPPAHAARLPQAVREFEEFAAAAEDIFRGGRRADLDRWYLTLGGALLRAVATAGAGAGAARLAGAHRLHAALSALRAPALEPLRREARALYTDALRGYVAHHLPRPLEKLTHFFESVSEAVAGGAREDEVCYRTALSKHELRRLLALYPAHEVRKSLHRLYRTVEKQLSEEGGLLQVVWRHMQEEFIAQHLALQARIAACYPGAGLALPLSTQDLLAAFSDIAREH